MGIGYSQGPRSMPSYRRMMAFIDGENLTFNYQKIKESGKIPSGGVSHLENVYVWHPSTIQGPLCEIIRATYYTFAVGDDSYIDRITSDIKSLSFNIDSNSRLPSNLRPAVYKKDKQGRKTKGVDIQMTIDILTNVYNDNVDTVFLVTGDGDFVPIINEIIRNGKQVYLASFSLGLNPKLLNYVDWHLELDKYFFPESDAK